jgi:glycopeptide antibiotics resistance protein
MVSVTFFPMPVVAQAERGFTIFSLGLRTSGLNLAPLYFGNCWQELPWLCAMDIWQNILMTAPFGFGICFLVRLRPRDFVWLAFAPGLAIETGQLLVGLGLGVSYRSVDVNDVLFNTLGVWCGYGLYRVFAWLFPAFIRRVSPTR